MILGIALVSPVCATLSVVFVLPRCYAKWATFACPYEVSDLIETHGAVQSVG
jgi:hypothetical protein